MKLYAQIAQSLQARVNCEKSGNTEWFIKHLERIETLCDKHLPHGSGFDSGCKFDPDASTWSEHQVIVTPHLAFGFALRITGRDRRNIKDYIGDVFSEILSTEIAS